MNLKSLSSVEAPAHDETRGLLLEAAGEVFAEIGFRNATVREICRRAGANVAAVNYHFGDKETLYAEVLRDSQQKAFEKYPPLLGVASDAPPEEKLRAFIRSFLLRIFDSGSVTRFGKIMSREMVEPTGALDLLLEARIRPMADLLRGLVANILSRPSADEQVRLCCFSIVSQCVFFHHCRTMITRLFPEQRLDAAAAEQLAGHIARFSLAAMKHLPDPEALRSRRVPTARRRR
ncbi:MAG TPA: CerR family C-terminal domain-containing protein [Candidatus Sulfopaludibacter sp.]|nr:CerR family C-terminal domain-containing protein [Candidatus Sulfopaludibacter sp.]